MMKVNKWLEVNGLPPTPSNITKARKALSAQVLRDTLELRQMVIKEYHCTYFDFIVKVPRAKYALKVQLSKSMAIRYADRLLVGGSYVNSKGDVKQKAEGKPCYRFNVAFLRSLALDIPENRIDLSDQTWEEWTEAARTTALRHNAGCAMEILVCSIYNWTPIGENDKKLHTFHTDAIDENGEQHEIKLETGFFVYSKWTAFDRWEGGNQ